MQTWAITWEGEVYREVDLTLFECEEICRLTDRSWDALTPSTSPTALGATIAVMLARKGHNADEMFAKLREQSPIPMLRSVSWQDEEDRPETYEVPEGKVPMPAGKGSASKRRSTTGSSNATGETSGPPGSPSDAPSET